jgi:O-acetyl-ADP-ribose deacetylase (regulator of RNase III)
MGSLLVEHTFQSGQKIQIGKGDITVENVDAIVNAANSHLQHGGGVAVAISRCGGPLIQQESDAWVREHGPVSHSEPAVTSGGELPCRYVIHAVGPVWGEGDEEARLTSTVFNSLHIAERLSLTSIALPAISTGIFGFPVERAANVILDAIEGYFNDHPPSGINLVRLILYDQLTLDAFIKGWNERYRNS